MELALENPATANIALFDIVVRVPAGAKLEEIEQKGREAGVAPDRMATLVKALRSVPEAKIGAGVSKERADKAKEQFTLAGLRVEVTPVLGIAVGPADLTMTCPACRNRIEMTDTRQCPSCGVFVDKVTDEYLLKRKMMQKERAIIESKMDRDVAKGQKKTKELSEEAMRRQVREQLEKEYGISGKGGSSNKGNIIRYGLIAGVVVAAFAGGNSFDKLNPWSQKTAAAAESAKLMQAMPGKGGAAGAKGDPIENAANTSSGPGGNGESDLDDPIIQAADGKAAGKGLTVEQAVASAQLLAKSVGNNTAERAMNGTLGGPTGPSGPGTAGSPGGAAPGVAAGSATTTPGVPGAVAASPGGTAPAAAVPPQTKLTLISEFALQLAELGQAPRAFEVIKTLKASPDLASNAALASKARIAELEVRAWSAQAMAADAGKRAADRLKTDASALADPGERTYALGRIGAILSHSTQLSTEVSRDMLTQAAEELKSVSDAKQRGMAAGDWTVALGEVLQADATARARAGVWAKARSADAQLDTLMKAAPDDWSQARLRAIGYRMKQHMGKQDKATESLDAALALAAKQPSLTEQGIWLRSIAKASGAVDHPQTQAAIKALQTKAEGRSGAEKAQTLAQLALIYADAGSRFRVDQLRQAARATTGLSPAESIALNTDLIVRGDMAVAKAMHGFGSYSDAEVILQRVGGYLF